LASGCGNSEESGGDDLVRGRSLDPAVIEECDARRGHGRADLLLAIGTSLQYTRPPAAVPASPKPRGRAS